MLLTLNPSIFYEFDFDFKRAASFCEGDTAKIIFSPKLGDFGDYRFPMIFR